MSRTDEHNTYPLQPLKSPTGSSVTSNASTLSSGVNSTDPSHPRLGGHNCSQNKARSIDSFNYEQKYPADEEFKEPAPAARVWMTYNDEAMKYVVESVNDWREGLDMLLVFAAIFSAIVTTFLVQTCQDLRVDYGKVTATLVLELIKLEFELAKGANPDDLSPPSNMTAASSFHANTSDLIVNGLCFASLGLSLTTVLITALTTQWIHQYMAIPSGSPRHRARTCQFRNDSFQKWHVPLIIGLLPVLMHLALGIFFVGLVVYLHGLSGIIAATLGCIGGLAFLAYFSSNVLPFFFPDCPYKTPLTHYAYATLCYARRRFSFLWVPRRGKSNGRSLRDVEGTLVVKNARKLDALAIVWMHNTSPNLSVQSIALQAVSSLPFQSVKLLKGAEGILPSAKQAIDAHLRFDQPVDRLERFYRAAIRTGDGRLSLPLHERNRYSRLWHCSPGDAVEMLRENLLHTSTVERKLDIVLWAKIFQNALRSGLDWLEIDHGADGPPSPIWIALLECVIGEHSCISQNCDGNPPELRSFSLECGTLPNSELVISSYDLSPDGTTTELTCALANHMRPSLIQWLLHVGFPTASRSAANYTQQVPDDVFLMLTMLQSKSIQQTSCLPEDDDSDYECESLFYAVLEVVESYVIAAGMQHTPHKDIDRAAIVALRAVVNYDYFGTGTIMISQDEAYVVKSLFRGLNRRYEFSAPDDHNYTWLTPELFTKIWRVACTVDKDSADLIAHILTYVSSTGSHSYATEVIMSNLIARDWLQDFASRLSRLARTNMRADRIPGEIRAGYTYLAGAYVDAFFTLSATPSSPVYTETLAYISKPENLNALCTLLFLSDVEMQPKVWRLAHIVQCEHWAICLQKLTDFVSTAAAKIDYEELNILRITELRLNRSLYYRSFSDLPVLVRMLARNVEDKHYVPPLFTKSATPFRYWTPEAHQLQTSDTEQSSGSSTFKHSYWWVLLRREPQATSLETGRRASLEWSKDATPFMNILPNP